MPFPFHLRLWLILLFLQFIKLKILPNVTLKDEMQIGRMRLIYGGN